jgi:cytochrome c553
VRRLSENGRTGAFGLPFLFAAVVVTAMNSAAARAETKLFPERKELCLACHGTNGVSPTPETPSLGGLPEEYALLQLVEFRDGNRKSDVMREIVKGMTNDDLIAAAAFVASQPRPPVPPAAAEPARMAKGAALSAKHRCGQCHGAQYLGGAQMPPLRHQREDYLLKAMQDFKAERRLGDRAAMVEVVTPLGAKDLADLAYFLARVRN